MLRKVLVGVGSIIFLLGFNVVEARELEMRPFLYTQDFEETDPVTFWTTWHGKHTVNFKGLTREKSFSGRKSFKLDVTFEEGSFFYWSIPIKVPAEGQLNFSGRIFLGEETTGRAGLGVNVVFPPTPHSGCRPFGEGEKGEWRLIEEDLVRYGKNTAKGVITRHIWGAKGENVGIYVDRILLFLWGSPGQRVVLYVDDIKVEGEVPTEEAYQKEIRRRWAPAKERFEEKISSWEKSLKEASSQLQSLTNLSPVAEKIKEEAKEKITSLEEKIEEAKNRGFIKVLEQKEIDPALKQFKNIIPNIKAISGLL